MSKDVVQLRFDVASQPMTKYPPRGKEEDALDVTEQDLPLVRIPQNILLQPVKRFGVGSRRGFTDEVSHAYETEKRVGRYPVYQAPRGGIPVHAERRTRRGHDCWFIRQGTKFTAPGASSRITSVKDPGFEESQRSGRRSQGEQRRGNR